MTTNRTHKEPKNPIVDTGTKNEGLVVCFFDGKKNRKRKKRGTSDLLRDIKALKKQIKTLQKEKELSLSRKLKRERDEALNVLREINDWLNVAAMRPRSEITMNEVADTINMWGDKIRPILEDAK
jgi:hypothetical protein